jgi:hypothetical protein
MGAHAKKKFATEAQDMNSLSHKDQVDISEHFQLYLCFSSFIEK